MPVKIPENLPAANIPNVENIFTMTDSRAASQDIRPLRVAILNLMPVKQTTETQLLRVIGNSALQVDVTFLHTSSYIGKNTAQEHLRLFYRKFDEIECEKFDGLIVTGAPVEKMRFEEVAYWSELVRIIEWADTHVFSSLFICWAAQAALYHYYGINKYPLDRKIFGVYEHVVHKPKNKLVRGFDDTFYAPHSRHTAIMPEDIIAVKDLELLSTSSEAGVYLISSRDESKVFVTGHCEYDPLTLDYEYKRDRKAGLDIDLPNHYYPDGDSSRFPIVRWRAHGNLLFNNWLNYFVYQETTYNVKYIPEKRERDG